MEVYLILWCGSFSQAFTVNRVLEFVMVSKLFDTVDKCFSVYHCVVLSCVVKLGFFAIPVR